MWIRTLSLFKRDLQYCISVERGSELKAVHSRSSEVSGTMSLEAYQWATGESGLDESSCASFFWHPFPWADLPEHHAWPWI